MKKMMTNKEMVETVNRIVAMQERENGIIERGGQKLFGNKTKVTYAIRKNKEKLLDLLKPYNKEREALLKECNEEEARRNGAVKIKKDCRETYDEGMKELLEIEVEADVHMVKFEEIEGLELSTNDMEAIEFMLTAPEGFDE